MSEDQQPASSSATSRLFRPWDTTRKSNLQRKRNKCSRRDVIKVESSHLNTQLPINNGLEMSRVDIRDPRLDAAATADALYAELSRADLARLGLVCPADLARLRARKQRPKKYRCPHCHVAFSNNGQLRGHIRIHTGERPFACQHVGCGKAFTRNEELTRHRRIHSGIRPYPCADCGKRFGRKDHLKKHARTHQKVHHAPSSAAVTAAFNAFFPLDPATLLLPYPYPVGMFGL